MTDFIENSNEKKYATFEHSFRDPWANEDVYFSFRFAKPNTAEVNRFSKEAAKNQNTASQNLLISLIHSDDAEALKAACQEHPGLKTSFAGAVAKACGFGDLGN